MDFEFEIECPKCGKDYASSHKACPKCEFSINDRSAVVSNSRSHSETDVIAVADLPITFWYSIKSCFRKYLVSKGRAPRAEFLYWFLFRIICTVLALMADDGKVSNNELGASNLVMLVLFAPTIMVTVRRLHDIGLSGWCWWLWITCIGIIPLLYFLFVKKGDGESNRYGANPYHHLTEVEPPDAS